MAAGRLRSLASDTMVYGSFTIIGKFLTFLLTPFYAHYLSMAENGYVATVFSFVAFLNVIYSLGMDSSFFRFYSKNDFEETRRVYSHSYISIAVVSFIVSLLMFLLSPMIGSNIARNGDGMYIIMLAAFIPFLDSAMIVPFAMLRMQRKARKFSITRLALIVLAVLFNILFVAVLKWGAKGVFAAQLSANIVGNMIFIPEILKYIKLKINREMLKDMLRFGLPTVPASFSSIILQLADRPILQFLTNANETGMYTINYKLGIPMMLVVSFFEYAWKPFYLSHYEDKDAKQLFSRILTYFTIACALCFLVTGFFIEYIVKVPLPFGRTNFIPLKYWSGMGIIPIILSAYYFNGMYINFAAGCYIEKKTKYLPAAIGVAGISNIVLNFILIPFMGFWGAAWATLGAYAISALMLYYYVRKIYPINYEWSRLIKIYASTAVAYFAGMTVTSGMNLGESFFIRLAFVGVFFLLLVVSAFFTKEEISRIRSIASLKRI